MQKFLLKIKVTVSKKFGQSFFTLRSQSSFLHQPAAPDAAPAAVATAIASTAVAVAAIAGGSASAAATLNTRCSSPVISPRLTRAMKKRKAGSQADGIEQVDGANVSPPPSPAERSSGSPIQCQLHPHHHHQTWQVWLRHHHWHHDPGPSFCHGTPPRLSVVCAWLQLSWAGL